MNAPSMRPPLPDSWVERIFDRMQGLYGSLWLDRWRSGEMIERSGVRFDRGLLLAKATWGQDLAGFADQPGRIAKALEACRHRNMPPTLPEFLDLCRQQYADAPAQLPAPEVPHDIAQARAAAMRKAAEKIAGRSVDGLAWARTPPAGGARGSHWEKSIIELVEAGDHRFAAILADHVERGVIVSARASAALNTAAADAAA